MPGDESSEGVKRDIPEQRSAFAQIVRSTGLYTALTVVQRGMSILLLPLYTRYLTTADYGVLDLLDTMINLFGILAGSRFVSAFFYFYGNAASQEAKRRTLGTAVTGSILVGFVAFLLGFGLAPFAGAFFLQGHTYTFPLALLLLSFASSLPAETARCWLKAEDQPIRFGLASTLQALLNIFLTVLLVVHFRMGYMAVLWASAVSGVLAAVGTGAWALRESGLQFDKALFLQMARYTAPLGISGLSLFVLHSADRFFLKRSTTLAEIGTYALAYKFGMLLSLLTTAFYSYWHARMYQHVTGNEQATVFSQVMTHLLAITTWVAFGMWMLAGPILRITVDASYLAAVKYIPWLLLAYLLRTAADYLRTAFLLKNRVPTDAKVNVYAAAVCLAAYAALIPRWQVWGAVVATNIGFLSLAFFSYFSARRVLPFRIQWGSVARLGATAAALWFARLTVPVQSIASQFIFGTLLTCLFPLLLWQSGYLRGSELLAVKEEIRRFRQARAGGRAEPV